MYIFLVCGLRQGDDRNTFNIVILDIYTSWIRCNLRGGGSTQLGAWHRIKAFFSIYTRVSDNPCLRVYTPRRVVDQKNKILLYIDTYPVVKWWDRNKISRDFFIVCLYTGSLTDYCKKINTILTLVGVWEKSFQNWNYVWARSGKIHTFKISLTSHCHSAWVNCPQHTIFIWSYIVIC